MSNQIRFIDSQYNELFRIPDGGNIVITRPDGEISVRACKYIDECHTQVGNYLYHICEFAEKMENIGARYEPERDREVVAGYVITDRMLAGSTWFVLAENPDAVQKFVTWVKFKDGRGYDWGNYFSNRSDAYNDLIRRASEAKSNIQSVIKPKNKDRER